MATLSLFELFLFFAGHFRKGKFPGKRKRMQKIPDMPDEQKAVQFPLPPRFWDAPGDVPSFRLWTMQLENYIFSVDSQCTAANRMMDEFKNRLVLSLLGSEGIASFACIPEVEAIADMSFTAFFAAAKRHFQPTTSPIRA
ncbi:MAG: hypothetical protein GY862_34590, partial [Gammaproteobacteria bacterium]|nr:hypothetical protein [Gammaproteobacteria bacterium]